MEPVFLIILSAAVVLLVIICGILLVWAVKLGASVSRIAGSMDTVRANLPDRNLLKEISSLSNHLSRTISSLKSDIEEAPERLTDTIGLEIRNGIEPLREEIQTSFQGLRDSVSDVVGTLSSAHERLEGTLMTLNTNGELSDWVNALRETTDPLNVFISDLDSHYGSMKQLLDTLEHIAVEWSGRRRTMEEAFGNFTNSVEKWVSDETIHMRDIEHRIIMRLEETSEITQTVAGSLSALQTAQSRMSVAIEGLSTGLSSTTGKFEDLLETTNRIQKGHLELIGFSEEVQTKMKSVEEALESRTEFIAKRLDEVTDRTASALQKNISQLDRLTGMQREISEDQASLIQEARNFFRQIPLNKILLVSGTAFLIHVILTAMIIYGIFHR